MKPCILLLFFCCAASVTRFVSLVFKSLTKGERKRSDLNIRLSFSSLLHLFCFCFSRFCGLTMLMFKCWVLLFFWWLVFVTLKCLTPWCSFLLCLIYICHSLCGFYKASQENREHLKTLPVFLQGSDFKIRFYFSNKYRLKLAIWIWCKLNGNSVKYCTSTLLMASEIN